LVFADGIAVVVVVGVVLEIVVVEALEIVAGDVVVTVAVVDGVAAVTVFVSFLRDETGIHGLKGLTDLVSSSPSTVVIVVSSEIGSNLLFFNGAAITTGS